LQLFLANEKRLYDAMHTKRKATAVAWEALMFTANDVLKNDNYPKILTATSEQLKKWLNEYGNGYETIADTVEWIKQQRLERIEEDKNNA